MKKFKYFLTIVLTVLLMLCMSIGLGGCSGCQVGAKNRNKLAEIPKEGNYAFMQSSTRITYGDSCVLI